jgi:hypothetical protein
LVLLVLGSSTHYDLERWTTCDRIGAIPRILKNLSVNSVFLFGSPPLKFKWREVGKDDWRELISSVEGRTKPNATITVASRRPGMGAIFHLWCSEPSSPQLVDHILQSIEVIDRVRSVSSPR